MDIPYSDVDRIAKMVPTQLNITLEKAIEDSQQLREAMEKDGQIRELIQTERKLEGMVRNSGVHAAGEEPEHRQHQQHLPVIPRQVARDRDDHQGA